MNCISTIKIIIFIAFTTISSSIEVEFSLENSHVSVESQQNRPFIVWRVPIGCDYSGFFIEVLNFLIGLDNIIKNGDELLHLDIGICSPKFLNTLAPSEAKLIHKLQSNYIKRYTANPAMIDWTNTILIHHKLPYMNNFTFCCGFATDLKNDLGVLLVDLNIFSIFFIFSFFDHLNM